MVYIFPSINKHFKKIPFRIRLICVRFMRVKSQLMSIFVVRLSERRFQPCQPRGVSNVDDTLSSNGAQIYLIIKYMKITAQTFAMCQCEQLHVPSQIAWHIWKWWIRMNVVWHSVCFFFFFYRSLLSKNELCERKLSSMFCTLKAKILIEKRANLRIRSDSFRFQRVFCLFRCCCSWSCQCIAFYEQIL